MRRILRPRPPAAAWVRGTAPAKPRTNPGLTEGADRHRSLLTPPPQRSPFEGTARGRTRGTQSLHPRAFDYRSRRLRGRRIPSSSRPAPRAGAALARAGVSMVRRQGGGGAGVGAVARAAGAEGGCGWAAAGGGGPAGVGSPGRCETASSREARGGDRLSPKSGRSRLPMGRARRCDRRADPGAAGWPAGPGVRAKPRGALRLCRALGLPEAPRVAPTPAGSRGPDGTAPGRGSRGQSPDAPAVPGAKAAGVTRPLPAGAPASQRVFSAGASGRVAPRRPAGTGRGVRRPERRRGTRARGSPRAAGAAVSRRRAPRSPRARPGCRARSACASPWGAGASGGAGCAAPAAAGGRLTPKARQRRLSGFPGAWGTAGEPGCRGRQSRCERLALLVRGGRGLAA